MNFNQIKINKFQINILTILFAFVMVLIDALIEVYQEGFKYIEYSLLTLVFLTVLGIVLYFRRNSQDQQKKVTLPQAILSLVVLVGVLIYNAQN